MVSPLPSRLVLGCHFSGVFDVNRRHTLPDDAFDLVKDWADSIAQAGLTAVLFHNSFSPETIARHQSRALRFQKVAHDTAFSPNVYRYGVYAQFLQSLAGQLDAVFVTDVSDVLLVNNPFEQPDFLARPNALFCGDEPKTLQNDWMLDHGAFFRQSIEGYARFEADFASAPLLNCGVIGGSMTVMLPFLQGLWALHERFNINNNSGFTGDMGLFNYLVRTKYNAVVAHGKPVNTVFKAYETERTDCWFRHK